MKNLLQRAVALAFFTFPGIVFAIPGDADNDGLRDEVETGTGIYVSPTNTGTKPNVKDSDGDGVPDGVEVSQGTNPNDPNSKSKRPNIIFINCDDLGYGDVGCFWQNQRTGTQRFSTPNLDQMAAEGSIMTNHYAGAPICCSSRASLMQGRHQGHSDNRDRMFDQPLPDNHSIATTLRAAGYRTIHVGKAGLAGSGSTFATAHPLKRGFDRFFGYLSHFDAQQHYPQNGTTSEKSFIYDDYSKVNTAYVDLFSADAFTGFAKKTIIDETHNNPDRPFFLYIAYDTPHFLTQNPPTATYPAGNGLNAGIQWTGAPSYVNTAVNDPARIDNNANFHPSTNPSWSPVYRKYVSLIRRLDDSVADILQTLRDLSIDNNTLVVFTSDNGPDSFTLDPRFFQSYAGFTGLKQFLFDGGFREPTIVWWPGTIPATGATTSPRKINRPSAQYDWLATFAEIAKVPQPAYTDGVSLLPDLTGQGTQRDKGYLYFEFYTGGEMYRYTDFGVNQTVQCNQMQAIRIGDFMGIRPDTKNASSPFRIYNMTNDARQQVDLASLMPDMSNKMKRLAVTSRRPHPTVTRPIDNEPMPPDVVGPKRNGVNWKAYEGAWSWLPEFDLLTPAATGMSNDISPARLTRNVDAGLSFTGYISVPTTGSYTFETTSDSSCALWIHEAQVIDNDYNYTPTKQGSPILLTAGLHIFRIYYRHFSGTPQFQLKWSGPGFATQFVPSSSLFVQGPPAVLQPDNASTSKNTPIVVDVLANDSSSTPITLASVSAPRNGTTSIVSGMVRYTPDRNFYGTDTFTYQVSQDGLLQTSSVTVTVFFDNETWIPIDDGTGSNVTQLGGGNSVTGVLSGPSDPNNSWIAGRTGAALRFRAGSDKVNFPGLTVPTGSSPRTFSCWFSTSETSPSGIQTLLSYGDSGVGRSVTLKLTPKPSAPGQFVVVLDAGGCSVVASKVVNDGQWHHLAVVMADLNASGILDVSESKIYIDGFEDAPSEINQGTIDTGITANFCLGGSNLNVNGSYAGNLDEVRVFTRALSSSEVSLISQASSSDLFGGFSLADHDGDGVPDIDELTAGTNPNDKNSYFRIASLERNESGLVLKWSVVAGRTYQIEESNDLVNWHAVSLIAPLVVTASAPETTATVPMDGSRGKFFRVSVNQTPAP